MNTAPEKILLKGNEAVAHGALAAGLRCYFGYPITPQNEIPEMLSSALPEAGGEFVQAESELASANMLMGAVAAGVRAMTSSSSPGMSLMQEAISYMAGGELPGVMVNMSRGGPGLGDINPAQGDYYQSTRGGGHGDYRTLVLAPSGCQEAHDMMIQAFDLAWKYRNPVIVLGDGIIGAMKEPVRLWKPKTIDQHGADGWILSGCKSREKRLIRSLFLEEGALAVHNLKLNAKYQAMQVEVRAEEFETADAELVVVAFGSIARIVKSVIRDLRAEGHKIGLARPLTLYPFPSDMLLKLAKKGKRFLTIEHNLGQMVDDVRLAVRGYADSEFFSQPPGNIPSTDDFSAPILDAMRRK